MGRGLLKLEDDGIHRGYRATELGYFRERASQFMSEGGRANLIQELEEAKHSSKGLTICQARR